MVELVAQVSSAAPACPPRHGRHAWMDSRMARARSPRLQGGDRPPSSVRRSSRLTPVPRAGPKRPRRHRFYKFGPENSQTASTRRRPAISVSTLQQPDPVKDMPRIVRRSTFCRPLSVLDVHVSLSLSDSYASLFLLLPFDLRFLLPFVILLWFNNQMGQEQL
jgi:hypothetical protein